MSTTKPIEVINLPETRLLEIRWEGVPAVRLSHYELRLACPCPGCKENSGKPSAVAIPAQVAVTEVHPAGQHGVLLIFSDGHARGVYPWTLLLDLVSVRSR